MEGKEQNEHYITIRRWSIGTFIAVLALLLPATKGYVDYRAREIVSPIATSQQHTSNKLDFLVKAEAARMVDDLKTRLVILRAQQPSPQLNREISELELRIDRAVVYRDCVIAERPNCDALRVF